MAKQSEPEVQNGFWQRKLRSPGFLSIGLALVTFLAYLPVLRNDFVNYDDPDYVTANSHVLSGLKWANVAWAFQSGHASNWHPLTWVSHMLDCQLFGQRAGWHHLVNLIFHVINTVLLLLVLWKMTGEIWRSALLAALFGLHPLHVESVAWISERKDVLSGLFFMLTLGAYTFYVQARHEPTTTAENASRITHHASRITHHPAFFYFLTLFFFCLGLMSKPMLVTLPFVLLLLDYWPFSRLQRENRVSNIRTVLLEKLPFLVLAVVSSRVTMLVQSKGGAVSTSISLEARIANALVSYVRYLWKMVWPQKLSVLYPHPGEWPMGQVALCAALLLLVSIGMVLLMRRRPWMAVGWFWFLGMMIPVIGLIQVGIQSMADRYMYLPMIGLLLMLAGRAERRGERGERGESRESVGASSFSFPSPPFSLLCLPVLACGVVTWFQVQHWRNSETLFRRAVQVTEKNYLAYNNLGFYLSNRGKVEEAMENYRKALEINPNYEDALNNMGHALASQKKHAEAIPYYEAALRLRPNHTEVHNNFGNALSELGKLDEAIAHYRIVLSQKPDHADAHNNLGIALAMQGKFAEAVEHFEAAIRLKPNNASAHGNLGNALAVQHKLEDAIREYQECLRLNPKDAQAHNNLANALFEQGKTDEAIRHYTEALALNADNPEAHYNLGLALARQGNVQAAREHYIQALRLKPNYADAQKQLNALGPQ